MKTNQMMTVTFGDGVVQVSHLDMMGDLNQFFALGNTYRQRAGKSILRLHSWLASDSVKEYISIVSQDIGRDALITKTGKGGYIRAHLRILIDASMYLDPYFKDDVIKTFVDGKLLQTRDLSGDNFIELNAQVALSAQDVLGKPSHTGHYIQLAKIIKSRSLPDQNLGWNCANSEQLHERTRIEMLLSEFLKNNLVRDWEHLKELAAKV